MRNITRVESVWILLFAIGILLVACERSVADEKPIAEFSFGDPQMLIFLPVQIDQATVEFLLDTGSSSSAYSSARKWPENPIKYMMARTGAGDRKVAIYHRPPSTLGPIILAEEDLIGVLDFTELSQAMHRPIHGVLGMDVLHHYVVQLDFEAQMVRFMESVPMECGTRFPFTASNDLGGTLTFELADSRLEILIDTGSACEIDVHKSRWNKLQKQGHLTRISEGQRTTAGGKVKSNEGLLDSIRLGQHSFEKVGIKDTSIFEKVGLKFLSRFLVTFDFPGQAVYLKPNRYFLKSRPFDASGMGLTLLNNQIVVSSLRERSPAADIGIRTGDVILDVEDRKSEDWSLIDLRDALSVHGKMMPMTIQRAGQSLEISIELADY